MLEILTVVSWAIAYILIIVAGFQSRSIKRVSMPYVAGVLNVAWEICALLSSRGFWGYVLWLALDFVIVYFGFRYLSSAKQKVWYVVTIAASIAMFYLAFQLPDGFLISVFVIDLVMAVSFIVRAKSLSPHLKIPIAVVKLVGDLFAGLMFAASSAIVAIIAVLVFLCNLFYLCYCMEERSRRYEVQKKNGKR